ncbi:thioredoxin family protein [Herbiconiux sp.]|uniref:TlpA family protein disulfide reductase n=1 Tax=Herbiconiux sp. TaxID=1871186 RepID=UPI0025BB26ED|nr:thioredoxin family protein [Herbiconiux sp.]
MDWIIASVVVVALVGATTAVGLLWRRRQGAASPLKHEEAPLATGDFGGTFDGAFGERATLVQFSTEFCSSCPGTRRVLSALAAEREGVAYLDVDVTHRADLVRRFSLLQTPTTLVLDRRGVVRTRIGGAVRRSVVIDRLEEFA